MLLDFEHGVFRAPPGRRAYMLAILGGLLSTGSASLRSMQRFIGLVWASRLALGPGLHMGSFYLLREVQAFFLACGLSEHAPAADLLLPASAGMLSEAAEWRSLLQADPAQPFRQRVDWGQVGVSATDA